MGKLYTISSGEIRGKPDRGLASLQSCSCIIPFYNEGYRVSRVVNIIKQINCIGRIVCVDDGSDDGGAELLYRNNPDVKLLRLPKNQGKAGAIAQGLEWINTPYVLLVDADLKFLKSDEIDIAVQRILERPNIDMIILRRIKAGLYSKLTRGDVLFAGERIMKSQDLRSILSGEIIGYQLEILINKYMNDHNKTVYWMPSSAKNTLKINKRGPASGILAEIDMTKQILQAAGVKTYLEQYHKFARQELVNIKSMVGTESNI